MNLCSDKNGLATKQAGDPPILRSDEGGSGWRRRGFSSAWLRALCVFMVLFAVAISYGQQDMFHRPSPFAGTSILTLAVFDEVRVELKTTPEIQSQEDGLLVNLQRDFQESVRLAKGDLAIQRPAIAKINDRYDEECLKLFTADQAKRLKQLFVQYNGGNAITNGVIAKDLAITDEQKAKIQQLQDDSTKAVRGLFDQGLSAAEMRDERSKLREKLKNDLEKLLSVEQLARYKAMFGEKFTFKG